LRIVGNPFEFSEPVVGSHFANRRQELQALTSRMLAGQNVFLISPRRYGKTSLILSAQERVRRRGGRTGLANLFWCQTRQDVARELADAVVRGPLGWFKGHLEEVKRRVASLPGAVLAVEKDGYRLSLAPLRPQTDWIGEIRQVMRLLAEAREGQHPVSLVIDEFQKVADIDPLLPNLFKSLSDGELRGVSLVLSGSRRHVMHDLYAGPGAPLLGVGELMALDLIARSELTAFLTERTAAAGKSMLPGAADLLYDFARGVPAYVQRLAYEAFDQARGEIDEAVARTSVAMVLRRERQFFEVIYEDLKATQRSLVRTLALHPSSNTASRDFLDRAGIRAASSVQTALKALEQSEKIELGPRGWQVTDPLFALWLAGHPE